jgi:hypothetical protein
MSQVTVTSAFPPTAAIPVGAAGAGRLEVAVRVTLVEVNPVAVAVRVMEPG